MLFLKNFIKKVTPSSERKIVSMKQMKTITANYPKLK